MRSPALSRGPVVELDAPITTDQLRALAALVEFLDFPDPVSHALPVLYEQGWVRPFDWPTWGTTPEGQRLRDDPRAQSDATPEELVRLITAYCRADRFVEGVLQEALTNGTFRRLTQRAAELVAEREGR